MRKSEKIMLIVAALLIAFGVVIFVAAMSWSNWDFESLSTESYETNTYSVTEDFRNISIDTKTADIQILSSEDDFCKVVCFASEKEKYHVSVENDVLTICAVYEKKWYDYIEIMAKTKKITLYLPKHQYDDLMIRESTGDIELFDEFVFKNVDISLKTGDISLKNVLAKSVALSLSTGDVTMVNVTCENFTFQGSAGDLHMKNVLAKSVALSLSTGDVTMVNVTCENFTSQGSTGDLHMKNVLAEETIFIKKSTGDVEFEACDAEKVTIQMTTGDVEGSFLSGKYFDVRTNTGDVEIPHGSIGGICEITTSTGDIKIDILS